MGKVWASWPRIVSGITNMRHLDCLIERRGRFCSVSDPVKDRSSDQDALVRMACVMLDHHDEGSEWVAVLLERCKAQHLKLTTSALSRDRIPLVIVRLHLVTSLCVAF